MTVNTQIEIEASLEEVMNVFFDFLHWAEIKSGMIKTVTRLPGHAEGPVQKGETLNVNFGGMKSQVTVLGNPPSEFKWWGDTLYVMSGKHSFRFEPSKTNTGGTTFYNSEEPFHLNILVMKLLPATAMFNQFCKDFKARVESVKKEGTEL
ncbi:hypothetical protein BDZ45DRAFT_738283 [Acephala macrosclerotiorum]|nr:hypothetical protein BDZ45DRAFT_738283 [Acephala macrosclerotiorum]